MLAIVIGLPKRAFTPGLRHIALAVYVDRPEAGVPSFLALGIDEHVITTAAVIGSLNVSLACLACREKAHDQEAAALSCYALSMRA